ncbi:helix-turn-helix domain-containing protein [Halopiger xanaduensis]|uniref:Bacterio-opsin activator HTH domain protein n=1 Tax=Halopiger xanaduensis (strain DSM 18323 / JCM 14033 / SH-6) TaxID=797210 RepID=F8D370_HALXS|nr:helix-turn-helix domain-containing protein [Halopiger xanaduensis]AEH38502.1 Bacterio-opsin activator HTH domain protein [Halopiger xanaduensis SH-6]
MRFVDVTVERAPSEQSPLNRRLAADDEVVREELLNWRMSRNEVLNQLIFAIGNRDAYEAALEDVAEIVAYEIRAIDEDRFYVYLQEERTQETVSWWTVFLAHDFIHVPPVVIEDGSSRLTLLGEFDDLRTVVDELSDEVTIEIEEIGDYRGHGHRLTGRLTARQYRAVRIALERGYYEIPRETSLAAIAAALECTESTASDILRRAERELVRAIVPSVHRC